MDDDLSARFTAGSDVAADMTVVATTLLAIQRQLGRIEERLRNLETWAGFEDNTDIEPDVAPEPYWRTSSVEAAEYGQSALRRTWDPVRGRYRYEPEP
jgi:hypothetical protein